MFDTPAILNLQ